MAAVAKINKNKLNCVVEVLGKITNTIVKPKLYDGIEEDVLELTLYFSRSRINIYESNPKMLKELSKFKVDDVLWIEGYYKNEWYPGKKSSTPHIYKIINFKKMGVIENGNK